MLESEDMKAFDSPIETERLVLRRITKEDWKNLASMLQDEDVMYAYEHAFSNDEVTAWLDKQLLRYEKEDGLGLLGLCLRGNGAFIGQCGLTYQQIRGRTVAEIGYLLKKQYWHKGYATEAAIAVRDYAFNTLGLNEVYSIIRENNFASQQVALRCGMQKVDTIVKHYYNMDMIHYCYRIKRNQGA